MDLLLSDKQIHVPVSILATRPVRIHHTIGGETYEVILLQRSCVKATPPFKPPRRRRRVKVPDDESVVGFSPLSDPPSTN